VKLPRFPVTPVIYLLLLLTIGFSNNLPGDEHKNTKSPTSAWIVRYLLLSKNDIDTAVRDLSDAGIKTVFLQVSGRCQSFFPSAILATAEELDNRGDLADPFKYFINKAQQRGISVHAWINVLFAWSKPQKPAADEHPFNLHPEWFTHNKRGESYRAMTMGRLNRLSVSGYFLSPAEEGVVNLMGRYIEEIVTKYNVQGIHLDYIRYPTRGSGVGPEERSLFERRFYMDPLSFETDNGSLVERYGEEGVRDLDLKWKNFRAGLVTDLVRSIRADLRRSGQDILLSAAVFPDPDSARVIYGQDWPTWIAEDLVDFVAIMNYSPNMSEFVRVLQKSKKKSDSSRIVVGVATYNQSITNTLKAARFARDWGFDGVSFFSYNDISTKRRSLEHIRRFIRESEQ